MNKIDEIIMDTRKLEIYLDGPEIVLKEFHLDVDDSLKTDNWLSVNTLKLNEKTWRRIHNTIINERLKERL